MGLDDAVRIYTAAVSGFTDLVRRIPAERFDGPGLGDWDLRTLIGHTARSLATVIDYLDTPAGQVDIDSPGRYYRLAANLAAADPTGVRDRAVRAGTILGADPAAAVDAMAADALSKLAGRDDELIAVLAGAGMRLSAYLPTRIFELVVHSMDIADVTGVQFTPPTEAVSAATELAAQSAVALGHGEVVLRALTGRAALPTGFSVTA